MTVRRLAQARGHAVHPGEAFGYGLTRHGGDQSPARLRGGRRDAGRRGQCGGRGDRRALRPHRGRAHDGGHLRRRHDPHLRLADGRHTAIDNYSLAPAGARADTYRPMSDAWPDYLRAQGDVNSVGVLAVGVPGTLKAVVPVTPSTGPASGTGPRARRPSSRRARCPTPGPVAMPAPRRAARPCGRPCRAGMAEDPRR